MLTLTPTMHAVSSRSNGFGASFFTAFTTYRNAAKTRKQLEMLSDHELQDIGLTRADIDAVASGKLHR